MRVKLTNVVQWPIYFQTRFPNNDLGRPLTLEDRLTPGEFQMHLDGRYVAWTDVRIFCKIEKG